MKCPACASEVPESSRFCISCGVELPIGSTPTLSQADAGPLGKGSPPQGSSPGPGAVSFRDTLDGRSFVPGTTLANRYRIVALVGKGGMGEVYRADDLKLGQAIALKFLPETLAQDGAALARFHREVRTARQVSHPNVCRVFDIGEANGRAFLTMEYVDGEDLASLLRRIGRVPPDKALQIARQLCAGLAAAHENGVLHRDLKPANVMIDGRGRARITDFGLAGIAEDFRGAEAQSGTPAYMAPEQLSGTDASVKSDLYSLGLVLYELFTGKLPFTASAMGGAMGIVDQILTADPRPPRELNGVLDKELEDLILACLSKSRKERPSALYVKGVLKRLMGKLK